MYLMYILISIGNNCKCILLFSIKQISNGKFIEISDKEELKGD